MIDPTTAAPNDIARAILPDGVPYMQIHRLGERIRRMTMQAGHHKAARAMVEIADADGCDLGKLVRWLAGKE